MRRFLVKIGQNLIPHFWHSTQLGPHTSVNGLFGLGLQKYYVLAISVSNFSPLNAFLLSILITFPVCLILRGVTCESIGHQLLPGHGSIEGTTKQPMNRRTDELGHRVANQATNNFLGSLRRLDCVCYAIIIFTIQYLTNIQPSYLRPRPKKGSRTFWMLRMGSFGHIFAKVH